MQFGNTGNGVGQVHLAGFAVRPIRQTVRDGLDQCVGYVKGQLLHAGYIFQRRLRSHGTIGNDVGYIGFAVLLRHPREHLAAPVVIKVYVDIGQRDSVRIEETFKQQIVLDGIYSRDT